MFNTMKKTVVAASAAALAVASLAACGSGSGDATPSQSNTPIPSASDSMVGGDPSTWAPVSVTMADNGATFLLVPDQAGNFVDLPESKTGYFVTTSDITVVNPVPSFGPETVPGFQALTVGAAKVIVWDKDPETDKTAQPILEVTIAVEKAMEDAVPAPSAS